MTRPPYRIVADLTRDQVRTTIENVGLAYDKLAPAKPPSAASKEDKPRQADFVRRLAEYGRVPTSYTSGFERWVRRTLHTPGQRLVFTAQEVGRVLCGLGAPSPTENGLTLHPLYGTPLLPGSSLKGVARAWADRKLPDDAAPMIDELFGTIADAAQGEQQGKAGLVSFLDAWWIPDNPSPWIAEVLTPHSADYYRGRRAPDGRRRAPDGLESPNPVTYLAARGSFRVVLEGPEGWLERAAELLTWALRDHGVGAKTRSGFGRFELLDERTQVDDAVETAEAARQRRLDELEQRRRFDAAWKNATDGTARLDAWRAFHRDSTHRTETLRNWLRHGANAKDEHLRTLDREEAGTVEWAAQELHETGGTKGLFKHLKGAVYARAKAALAGDRSSASTFGNNQLDPSHFPPPKRLKKRGGHNAFAKRIANGGYDEATVRAALAHLARHGAANGHLAVVRRAYGLEDA